MTTIDFNALMKNAGEGFQPVPTGPYNAQVAKTEATMSSTGKPMIKVQLQIIGGPHDGRRLFDQFVISADSPNALNFFFEHMASFGLDRSFFASNPTMEVVAATLMGRQILVSVGIKQYKGADRNEVQAYRPITGGQIGGVTGGVPGFGPGTAAPQAAPIAPPPVVAPIAPPPVSPLAPVTAHVAPVVAPAPIAPIIPHPAVIAPPAAIAPPIPPAPPITAPAPAPPAPPVAPAAPVQESLPVEVTAPATPPVVPVFTGDAEPF